MMTLVHFIRMAVHNLLRGGQRVLVAFLCITFGIMILVAMTMLAKSIEGAVVMEPAQHIGGDLSIGRTAEDTISPQAADQLQALQQAGEISRYTLIAFNSSSIVFRAAGSGDIHFVASGLGVEPEKYPLAGSLTIGEPGSTGLPTLLHGIGDVVVTRDLAEEYGLKVGDPIVISDLHAGMPLPAVIRGIAIDTPNHQGNKMYYSIATATTLAGGRPVVNTAILSTPHAGTVRTALEASGWTVDWSADRADPKAANAWVIGLRGAGILGLLVGGIGIANTMQVLLRRRQHEIAIWKTLGYHQGDLHLIFSIEAALLGLAGSLPGAGLGVLLSSGMLVLFRRTSTLLYPWSFSPTPLWLGILAGVFTTVIFAYWAIVVSSQARPAALLRNEPVDVHTISGCQSVLLGALLAALFTGLTGLIMESLLAGIIVLVCIAIGLGLLGGFFSGLVWICARVLPLRRMPLLAMAVTSLRRRQTALIFAMIALFIGAVSMSAGMLVNQKSQLGRPAQPAGAPSYNLEILAPAGQERAVRQALPAQASQTVVVGYRTALESLSLVEDGGPNAASDPLPATDTVLVGRSDPQDYVISGAAWGSQPDGVYTYQGANVKPGALVKAAFRDGETRVFTVVGSYEVNYGAQTLYPPLGLLMTADGFLRAAQPDSLTIFAQVPTGSVSQSAARLGAALPQATVIDLVAYGARFMQAYQRLYMIPLLVAGLAILAGLLLVGNAVSLALLDRRYEIGILKAVGYARGQILAIFAVEYGLIGMLAAVTGALLMEGLVLLLSLNTHSGLGLVLITLPTQLTMIVIATGLTLLTVLGVAWSPTRVPPLAVLNEQN